jgi:hypothetical protein
MGRRCGGRCTFVVRRSSNLSAGRMRRMLLLVVVLRPTCIKQHSSCRSCVLASLDLATRDAYAATKDLPGRVVRLIQDLRQRHRSTHWCQ